MSRPAFRRLWLKLHRYCALSFGCVLLVAAFFGGLLTVAKPLDRWLHPELFVQTTAGVPVQLHEVHAALQEEFGPQAAFVFRPPRESGDTLWAYVDSDWHGMVFMDAVTGRELGRRGEYEGIYNLLFELHSNLLLGKRGKALLAAAAATYVLLLATGLVLWWPRRWSQAFRIRWRAGMLPAVFDLHGAAGALLSPLLAVSVATGAYMAWPPLRPLVSAAFAEEPATPPRIAGPVSGPVADLDTLVAAARELFPDGMVGYVQVPGTLSQPVRVRLKLPDDPHPNGLTSVWLHPVTGDVLASLRWSELDRGHKLVAFAYPLHIGALGGAAHTVVVGLLGLLLASLGATGLWLWYRRTPLARGAWRGVEKPPV